MCVSDLLHGEEPEEHRAREQDDRGAERGSVHGAVWSQPRPDPQPGQHSPATHGEFMCMNAHTQGRTYLHTPSQPSNRNNLIRFSVSKQR